jgi:hypothetical protein
VVNHQLIQQVSVESMGVRYGARPKISLENNPFWN